MSSLHLLPAYNTHSRCSERPPRPECDGWVGGLGIIIPRQGDGGGLPRVGTKPREESQDELAELDTETFFLNTKSYSFGLTVS